MKRADLQVYLAIISTKRTQNVAKMQQIVGDATWYVGECEREAYRVAGAVHVKESGALCASRNAALRDAWASRLPCVQLSDDLCNLRAMRSFPDKRTYKDVPVPFSVVIATMLDAMQGVDAKLGGIPPTDNPLNYNPKRPVSTSNFIVGDFIIVLPCSLLFDERFSLKEDYDYTMQHLMRYGIVARCDGILAEFKHRTNPGGAVEIRTPQIEDAAIALLKSKWNKYIVDNTKRSHEVLLRWEKPAISHSTAHRSKLRV